MDLYLIFLHLLRQMADYSYLCEIRWIVYIILLINDWDVGFAYYIMQVVCSLDGFSDLSVGI